jgi:hypothetical protein
MSEQDLSDTTNIESNSLDDEVSTQDNHVLAKLILEIQQNFYLNRKLRKWLALDSSSFAQV